MDSLTNRNRILYNNQLTVNQNFILDIIIFSLSCRHHIWTILFPLWHLMFSRSYLFIIILFTLVLSILVVFFSGLEGFFCVLIYIYCLLSFFVQLLKRMKYYISVWFYLFVEFLVSDIDDVFLWVIFFTSNDSGFIFCFISVVLLF